MDLGLEGKVCLITGASGGIGRALAREFAAEGARLVLHAHRRRDELSDWLSQQAWRERAIVVAADVARADEVERAFGEAITAFGCVDLAIANAGVWPVPDQPLHELPVERLESTLAVNLFGAIHTARSFLKGLAAREPGHRSDGASLIFIGSTAARFGERYHSDYATSKAGLYGLMRSLKNEIVELDPGGRVNLIEPGWTVTEMARAALEVDESVERVVRTMPLRQFARAVDIARTALWLASPRMARHVTGQVVTVAGGMEGRELWPPGSVAAIDVRARTQLGD